MNGFTYRPLLPYINTIPEAVYREAMRISEAGVPVIVVGPPPEFTPDGKNIAADFARRVGFKPFTLAQYNSVLAEQTALPVVNEWEPSWIDATYPVETTTAQKADDQEGHLLYVSAADRFLYYMPVPDPREELTTLIAGLTTPLVETYAEDTYYRFFPHRRPEPDGGGRRRQRECGLVRSDPGRIRLWPATARSGPHQLKALFRLAVTN